MNIPHHPEIIMQLTDLSTSRLQEFLPPPGEPIPLSVTAPEWVRSWASPPVGYKYAYDPPSSAL